MNYVKVSALPLAATIAITLIAVPSNATGRKDTGAKATVPAKAVPDQKPGRMNAASNLLRIEGVAQNPDEGGVANAGNVGWGERFETGFAAGAGCGQNGWQGFCGGPGIGFEIIQHSPLDPRLQEFSAKHFSDGSAFAGFEITSDEYADSSGRVDYDVIISEDGLHYQLVPIDNNTLFFNTRIQFEAGGAITALTTTDCAAGVFSPTTGTWTPGVLMRIGVEVLPGGVLNLYKNGSLIFTGSDISQQCAFGAPNTDGIWTFAYNTSATAMLTLDNIGNAVQSNCLSDLTGPNGFRDGATDINDLLMVIGAWGPCAAKCPTDIAGPNGQTDINDLLAVIGAWGPCPDPTGACCTNGACSQATFTNCTNGGGSYLGDNVACTPTSCAANDECSSAATATVGANNATFVGGTTGSDPNPSCSFGAAPVTNDVWHVFTNGPAPATVQIDTTASVAPITDTVIAVYANCADAASGIELACDDDSSPAGLLSQVIISLAANQSIVIRTGIWNGSTPTGPFVLTIGDVPPPPANDECAGAGAVPPLASGPNAVNTASATTSPDFAACAGLGTDLWYNYVATSTSATFSTCGSTTLDTAIQVFASCGGTSLACLDDSCGLQTSLTVNGLVAGTTYKVRVGHFASGAGGPFTVTVTP